MYDTSIVAPHIKKFNNTQDTITSSIEFNSGNNVTSEIGDEVTASNAAEESSHTFLQKHKPYFATAQIFAVNTPLPSLLFNYHVEYEEIKQEVIEYV